MLSKAAFNALLKTLEEPPEHAVFILATTDADKLPATIISRTQQFSFRSISPADAAKHLKHIAKEEKILIDDDALDLIAQRGDGSFRDSISLLDQLRGVADEKTGITPELVENALGLAPQEHVKKLLAAYEAKDLQKIVELLDETEHSGTQPGILVSQLVQTVRGAITKKPQLLPLLDQLLEVSKSSQPNIKLLTVLAMHAVPKPKNAALSAPQQEVSAPIKELEKRATRPVTSSSSLPSSIPPQDRSTGERKEVARQTQSEAVSGNSGGEEVGEQRSREQFNPETFDWEKIIDYARQNFVAVYSVLSKCGFEANGEKLLLYTGNAFYKKKLDDSKHRINLTKILVETGVGDVEVETIPTPPPPKDSTAAAVAAIMGGGEEVKVDA